MIKILLDPQIFNLQKFGGISRYYTEIYNDFENRNDVLIQCPLLYTDNIHFRESPLFRNSYQKKFNLLIKLSKIFRYFKPGKLKNRSKERTLEMLQKQQTDVFIPTFYDPYFIDQIRDTPFVLTVYDMIHELYPEYFLNDTATVPNKKLLLEKADKIIAISESTKKDILKLYPHIPERKIEVVYLAYTINTEIVNTIQVPENYILFVGNRTIYKNFIFFLNSAAPILTERPNLSIVCAGGNEFSTEEVQLISKFGLTSQVIQRDFMDAELSSYYSKAICFIFPSEYEGFGIPVLESMACGCPVILANHSSFPEVAGDAGIYFKLNDQNDLREKICLLLDNNNIREKYRLKGIEQASRFTWKKTAEESLKIYQSI